MPGLFWLFWRTNPSILHIKTGPERGLFLWHPSHKIEDFLARMCYARCVAVTRKKEQSKHELKGVSVLFFVVGAPIAAGLYVGLRWFLYRYQKIRG